MRLSPLIRFALALGILTVPAMAGVVPIATPEPTTILTVGVGAAALIFYARRKRSRK